MSRTQFIITREYLSWEEAIDFALRRAGWLPSIEQANVFELPLCWTCNTDPKNVVKALLSDGQSGWKKSDKHLVILVGDNPTLQDVSCYPGDIKDLSTQLWDLGIEKIPKYHPVQEKWTRGIYHQTILAKEYKMPVVKVNQLCQDRKPFKCIRCENIGQVATDSQPVHELTHHTFPQLTREEAVELLWPNYRDNETE